MIARNKKTITSAVNTHLINNFLKYPVRSILSDQTGYLFKFTLLSIAGFSTTPEIRLLFSYPKIIHIRAFIKNFQWNLILFLGWQLLPEAPAHAPAALLIEQYLSHYLPLRFSLFLQIRLLFFLKLLFCQLSEAVNFGNHG